METIHSVIGIGAILLLLSISIVYIFIAGRRKVKWRSKDRIIRIVAGDDERTFLVQHRFSTCSDAPQWNVAITTITGHNRQDALDNVDVWIAQYETKPL